MSDKFPEGYSKVLRFEGALLWLYNWNGETRSYDRTQISDPEVFRYLATPCEIMEGTTLGHIFDFVATGDTLKFFLAEYSGCPAILEFHAQSVLPEKNDGVVDYLEIYQTAEVSRYKKSKPWNFEHGFGFHGIGTLKEDDPDLGLKKGDKQNYSVSYSPMNELAFLPIRVETKVKVRVIDEKFKILHEYECESTPTLLEVLNAIYWDISFMGGPEDNAKFLQDMKETVEGIKDGTIETFPLDLDELLKEDEDEDSV